jgi:opacity protein-like surface antigen
MRQTMHLNLKRRSSIGLILLSSIIGFTSPIDALSSSSEKTWHPIIALGLGSSSPSLLGKAQNFPIQNPITDEFYNYSVNNTSQTSALFDVFLGAEWNLNSEWIAQTGIDFNTATSPFTVNGAFVQGADSQSADYYTYYYQVVSRQLLLNGKLLYTFKEYYHPYLLGGLGAAFNKAYNYYTSVPADLTFTRMYLNNANTSFSYTLGLGVDVDITTHMRAGIGYRYADLGKIQLGNAFIDTTSVPGTLSSSNAHTNQLLVQLTWIFN